MAVDPLLYPTAFLVYVQSLEDRIRALEASNRLQSGTVGKGGTISVLNSAGVVIAEMGRLGYGENGLRVMAANGVTPILQVDQTQGFGLPWFSTEWKTPADAVTVTSGTFVDTWTTLSELMYSTQILFRVGLQTDGTTTGEVKVVFLGGPSDIGGTLTVPISHNASHEFRILHGLTIGGGPVQLSVQARRTSGAGTFTVFHPHPLHYGTNMSPVAGGWV